MTYVGALLLPYTCPIGGSTLGAPKWSKRVIFDAPRRAHISQHFFRKNGPFSSSNMSGTGTPTWEGVPKPVHIPFEAPNWQTITHKFGVRTVSHVVVRCPDIFAPDFQKMIKNMSFHASQALATSGSVSCFSSIFSPSQQSSKPYSSMF